MSNPLSEASMRAADWTVKSTSTLMGVARERAIAGDRVLRLGPPRARTALAVVAVACVIAAMRCATDLLAGGGSRFGAAAMFAGVAAVSGSQARWGAVAVMVTERITHWLRGLLALLFCVAAVVLTCNSAKLFLLAQAAKDPAELLINGAFLGLFGLAMAAVVALTCPAALSVAVVARRHVSTLRTIIPLLIGFSSGALLANAINIVTAYFESSDIVGVVVGVVASIAGIVSASRNRYRASAQTLAAALDGVFVTLTTDEDAAARGHAWNALARAVGAGGAPAGRRGNRLVDRHIGAILAVAMWKVGGVAPHLSPGTRSVVLKHIAEHGVSPEPGGSAGHALDLIAELKYRLAES